MTGGVKAGKRWEERVGHINLVVPVHIWYFRTLPNKIGYLLGLPSKKWIRSLWRYVVIQTVEGSIKWGR